MRLILIRHGQTDWNLAKRVQGRTDTDLNDKGRAQARAVAGYLTERNIKSVYCGPLKRAKDTAATIAKACGVADVHVMEGLTEINFGAWEGKTNDELLCDFPTYWRDWNWILHPKMCAELGAESAEQILDRSLGCIDTVFNENAPDATVAIISHTMPIKLIVAHSIGLPIERIRRIRVDNCGASTIDFDAEHVATLRCWNDTSYLGGLL